jgi:peptidyl-prolyl cis-trans isomerase D
MAGFKAATNTIDFVNSNSDVSHTILLASLKDLPAFDAEQLYNLAQERFALMFW